MGPIFSNNFRVASGSIGQFFTNDSPCTFFQVQLPYTSLRLAYIQSDESIRRYHLLPWCLCNRLLVEWLRWSCQTWFAWNVSASAGLVNPTTTYSTRPLRFTVVWVGLPLRSSFSGYSLWCPSCPGRRLELQYRRRMHVPTSNLYSLFGLSLNVQARRLNVGINLSFH